MLSSTVALGIAGCSSDDSADDPAATPTEAGEQTATSSPTAEPTATQSPTETEAGTAQSEEPQGPGTKQWEFDPQADADQVFSPISANGLVFLSTGGNTVHAIDGQSGEQVSSFNEAGAGRPRLGGDTLYVPGSSAVVAVAPSRSLDQRWRFEEEGETFRTVRRAGDSVFAMRWRNFHGDSVLYHLDASDGRKQLRKKFYGDTNRLLAADADTAYLATTELRAIDAADGSTRWTLDLGIGGLTEVVALGAVVDGETLYLATSEELSAIDTADGTVRWTADHNGRGFYPLVDGERIYVGGGELSVFDRPSQSLVWEKDVALAQPTLGDERVYATIDRTDLSAFDRTSGEEQWSTDTDTPLTSLPAYGDGLVYVVDKDGHLNAFST